MQLPDVFPAVHLTKFIFDIRKDEYNVDIENTADSDVVVFVFYRLLYLSLRLCLSLSPPQVVHLPAGWTSVV